MRNELKQLIDSPLHCMTEFKMRQNTNAMARSNKTEVREKETEKKIDRITCSI